MRNRLLGAADLAWFGLVNMHDGDVWGFASIGRLLLILALFEFL